MSVKDPKCGAECPICGEHLPGSDDAHMVYAGLVMQAQLGEAGNCDLCGEDCTVQQTLEIAKQAPPDTGVPYTGPRWCAASTPARE